MSKVESSGEAKPQDAPDVQADVSKDTNAEIYENRGTKKIIRVVTVMAYLFSVSFVGILLSAYYIFLWEPPNPRLIERGRLRADPQLQFLIAAMPSEKTDLREKENFLLATEINRAYKPLLSRMTYDGDDSNVNSQDEKRKRTLNAMLLKLRHSLMETHAQNRNLSKHEITISNVYDNSSIKVEKMLNSTKIMENSMSSELHKNITKEKTRNNNIDLPPKFMDPVNMLDIENTWTSKATESKTKQEHFNGKSVIDANLIIDHEKENRNYKKKHNVTKQYPVRKSNISKINDSNHHAFEHNNSFKAEINFSKIDILDNIKELIKQDENDNRQLINSNRKNDSNNVHTIAASKEYADDLTKRLLSINVSINSLNFRRNYSNNNEYPSSNHIKEMRRNEVSTISSSHDSEYIHNNPEFNQPSDEPTVVTRNSEETQIEKITRFTTIDNNKQLEEMNVSTTQRQKGLWKILTETTDIEETSVELTSVSTVRDYRNNFTNTVNIDDDDSKSTPFFQPSLRKYNIT
ncbi:uncharacterized protein [Anoplolepis gracilipes]|uniref:uncharacterized protein n=1 Tax=Anoplolepis gracilipes TaxID=354296 RepID=UPI003BA0E25C